MDTKEGDRQLAERNLFLFFQLGDALFDGLRFGPQVLQVLFEPGGYFLLTPEASPKAAVMLAAAGAEIVVMLAAPMPATVMSLRPTAHFLTSFLY
jgi:hypothetical protein